MRWVCVTKLASRTASGASFSSPQASDQHTKISSMNGNSAAAGFQTSWKLSDGSDWHISAIAAAVANISTNPPRRLASATRPMIASVFTAPIQPATLATLPKRTGSASSQ